MALPIEVGPNPAVISTIGTIVALPNVGVIGTIGTLQSGGGGGGSTTYLGTLAFVGTIGTIESLNIAATISSPVTALQAYLRSTILANVSVITSGAATLMCATLQDMVVDVVYGTVVAGSILTSVVGVEPTRSLQTGTLTTGVWFAGTVQGAERQIVLGPLGELVAVKYTVPGSSSILGVTITAEQSTTG